MIEELPKSPKEGTGFGGATKVIESPELLKQLEIDPKDHVDSRAFLAARLTDFLINDNDRNGQQWKWARIEGESKHEWEPIARDRDHAFVSYDGLMDAFGRLASASVVKFDGVVNTPGLTVVDDWIGDYCPSCRSRSGTPSRTRSSNESPTRSSTPPYARCRPSIGSRDPRWRTS